MVRPRTRSPSGPRSRRRTGPNTTNARLSIGSAPPDLLPPRLIKTGVARGVLKSVVVSMGPATFPLVRSSQNSSPNRRVVAAFRHGFRDGDGSTRGAVQRSKVLGCGLVNAALAEGFFVAGTIPFITAGSLHALGALVDIWRPTFFTPTEEPVGAGMRETTLALREMFPGRPRRTFWQAWLGFNISHGMGAAVFGILLLAIARQDFALVTSIGIIRPLSIGVGLAYFVLAIRCWFYLPAIAIGIGIACFVISTLV
jgi:hypothetical protein